MRFRSVLMTLGAFLGLAVLYGIGVPMLAKKVYRVATEGVSWSEPATGRTITLPPGFRPNEKAKGSTELAGAFLNSSRDRDIRLKHVRSKIVLPLDRYVAEFAKVWKKNMPSLQPGSPVPGKYEKQPFVELDSTFMTDDGTFHSHSIAFHSKDQREIWVVMVTCAKNDLLSAADDEALKKSFFPLSQ